MSRWLAVDYGHKRIGLAVGSTEDAMSSPVEVLPGGDEAAALRRIAAQAEQFGCDGIVVGWPLNMDDTEGPQGELTRAFAVRLADATGRDVRLWDERLSSFDADQALAGQLTRKKRKARQDALAAATFLNDFLRQDGPGTAPEAKADSDHRDTEGSE